MSKELFISSTPHETKLAIVEDDLLSEVYFERENEYTLAGSIYKGRVTRVLPGMQSAFVDVGLERDAFLYVTDFLEETEDQEEFDRVVTLAQAAANKSYEAEPASGGFRRPSGAISATPMASMDAGDLLQTPALGSAPAPPLADYVLEGTAEEDADESTGAVPGQQGDKPSDGGTRRWRGRRGRRGRGGREQGSSGARPMGNNVLAAERAEPNSSGGDDDQIQNPPSFAPQPTVQPPPESPARIGRPSDRPVEIRRSSAPAAKPQNYQPMIMPGESISKYRRQETPAITTPEGFLPDLSAAEALNRESERNAKNPPASELDSTPPQNTETIEESGRGWQTMPVPETTIPISQHGPAGFAVTTPAESGFSATPAEPPADPRTLHQNESGDRQTDIADQSGLLSAEETSPAETHAAHTSTEEQHQAAIVQSNPESQALEVSDQGVVGHGDSDNAGSAFSRSGSLVTEEQQVPDEEEEEGETSSFAEDLEDAAFDEFEEETLEGGSSTHSADPIVAGPHFLVNLGYAPGSNSPVSGAEDHPSSEPDGPAGLSGPGATSSQDDDSRGNRADNSEDLSDDKSIGEDLAGEHGFDDGEPDDADGEDLEPASAEAEVRAPSSTAPFQQAADRAVRRDRTQRRGGRPMQGGRGPRRNIQRGPMPVISDLLKEGQEILVQIAKEPMAKKGARITSHIALPGRFLVFMPTVNHMGVSRKISSEEERQRLKRILISERGTTHGGFIVRTAAAGASEDDLRADIRFLINLWVEIRARAESSKAPSLIYHDLNLVERILRDQVTQTYSQIWVDNEQEYERILRFVSRFQPSLVKRVKLYTKETPLFEQFNIQEEINKALKSKVWLKSGGSIVINQTEALVAIDINTGKYVGRTSRLEDTIVKTNVDAIKEIVRQIRLRDLGGIIVIDFIDMDERKNRNKVMQALEEALKSDRAPSKVLQFNDFGLVAITRKRVKQSLERTLGATCEYCTGTGMIKSVTTVCNEIYVEMRKMAKHFERQDIMLRAHPEVVKALKSGTGRWLQEMEELTGRTIILKSDPAQHQEQFDIQ